MLVMDHKSNECYFLKWKTFKKDQRKGRELDPKYFNQEERQAFDIADAKEWKSFLDTGAVQIVPPHEARKIDPARIFKRPMRSGRTDKSGGAGPLEAKCRYVTPGDCDPDGTLPIEDGGFRTDAPTCPQVAFHCFCSHSVRRRWKIGSFDVRTAFLSGEKQLRELYCKPPKEGSPGVHPDCLLKICKGVYGLREAPRLWYQKADKDLRDCGWEELKTARSTYCLRDPITFDIVAILLLYVDDALCISEYPDSQLEEHNKYCLLYTSPSPRDKRQSRMPSSA